ncbi:Pycsar system effector family protein [uncultured Maribacter sp.]|uniref:Pycsar system effector family protein n=1 Tax=uncultured Maribacter sp. TaxID=431308 RepID=UPI0030EEC880|tara:strand:+ start:8416 stop:9048 length:633 start_codon:yes stop_codon:yes gene_type:complete
MKNAKEEAKEIDKQLRDELGIDKEKLKELKKKLLKVEPRSERGAETLFRLVSKNQYTLNTMIDRKSNILISINALILSITIGTVLNQLNQDPHLIFPATIMLATNLISIGYAVFATRPELTHGKKSNNNLLFYGNFNTMNEEEYTEELTSLMYKGDELYNTIAKDTFHLGKTIDRKFKLLRTSFHVFLVGIVLAVIGFIACHVMFGDLFK